MQRVMDKLNSMDKKSIATKLLLRTEDSYIKRGCMVHWYCLDKTASFTTHDISYTYILIFLIFLQIQAAINDDYIDDFREVIAVKGFVTLRLAGFGYSI